MKHTRGVLFDLYGTLMTFGDMEAEMAEYLRVLHGCLCDGGLDVSFEEFREGRDRLFSMAPPDASGSGMTVYELRIQALCRDGFGFHPAPSVARRAAADTLQVWRRYTHPDPRIFAHTLDRIGLRPDEVVHVGDSPEDVYGARAAGITPILIRRDGRQGPPIEGDVATISHLSELLPMLL